MRERSVKASAVILHKQSGVALLEVLIVFFVLSIGLLGMAALQLKSIQYTQSSYMRSQAVVAVNDLMDRIRLNGGSATFADTSYTDWQAFVTGTLPDGSGSITDNCNGGICTVQITWTDRFDDDRDGDFTKTMTVKARM